MLKRELLNNSCSNTFYSKVKISDKVNVIRLIIAITFSINCLKQIDLIKSVPHFAQISQQKVLDKRKSALKC